jgi:hypothetical protein
VLFSSFFFIFRILLSFSVFSPYFPRRLLLPSRFDALPLPVLKTFLPDTKRFRREQNASRRSVFRSTLFPADRSLIRGSNLDKLVDELIELLK